MIQMKRQHAAITPIDTEQGMKTTKTLFLMSALIALTLNAPGHSWLTNGLVAYYPFSGNANDASGNGYDGTPTSVTYGADRNGQANKAAQFDGISSKIKIYGFPNGNFFPITLSVFVKGLPTYASNYGIIGNYGIASANGYALSAFTDHLESLYWGSQGSVFRDNRGLHANNTLDGKWHQIVVTYGLTGGVIYVDGVAGETLGWSGSAAASTTIHPVTIGDDDSEDGTQNRVFNGSIDDIRIYNRALSSSEVAQLYAIESFCSPHVAQATAIMSAASVVGANLADLGCGYTNAPSVRILGGGGTGATAIATMENGVVTGLDVTSPGNGYTNAPRMLIESPPFVPSVNIAVSKVKVTQRLRVNHHYVLEASLDLATWTTTGPAFTAESESIVNEFDVDTVGRFFRLREVP
jgi:hypothetical protein